MNFNLKIKEEILCKNNLLKYICEYDIYAYYIGSFKINTIMYSPFRTDKNPSFGIFYGKNGDLAYNDYNLGGGDVISFVCYIEKCNYNQALNILNERYNLNFSPLIAKPIKSNFNNKVTITNKKFQKKEHSNIKVKIKNWNELSLNYWKNFYIQKTTLEYFNVYNIEFFWVNNYLFKPDDLCFGYRYDTGIYKIYRPLLSTKEGKWTSNIKDKNIYQGHNQLKENDNILFITSSLKDVMVLHELGYSSIAPHTEHQILTDELFNYYQDRFDEIIILYDNDEAGKLHAQKMVTQFGLKSLVIPDEETKDPSDFVKKYDLDSLDQWLITQL